MELVVPPRISPAAAARARELASATFAACECEGMARIDMFVRGDGEVLVNELNTIPGFTPISLFPTLPRVDGLDFLAVTVRVVELALEREAARIRRTLTPGDLPEAYMRYLTNGLRDTFDIEGVPIRISLRKPKNPFADDEK